MNVLGFSCVPWLAGNGAYVSERLCCTFVRLKVLSEERDLRWLLSGGCIFSGVTYFDTSKKVIWSKSAVFSCVLHFEMSLSKTIASFQSVVRRGDALNAEKPRIG